MIKFNMDMDKDNAPQSGNAIAPQSGGGIDLDSNNGTVSQSGNAIAPQYTGENVRIVVAVRAVILSEVEGAGVSLLCVKAKKDKKWHLPGGWLDGFESLPDCCKREAYEELGVEIEVGHLMYVSEYRVKAENSEFNENVHKIEHFFFAKIVKGEIDRTTNKNQWVDHDGGLIDYVQYITLGELRSYDSSTIFEEEGSYIMPSWLAKRDIQSDAEQRACVYTE